jgi:hypothetical protein
MRTLLALALLTQLACGGVATDDEAFPTTSGPADQPGTNPGSAPAGKTCGEQEFKVARAIPDVLIVLDRSGSMAEGFGSPTLWDSSRSAIYELTGAMAAQVGFGLTVFPNSGSPYGCSDDFSCQTSASLLVPIGMNTAAAIKAALSPMQACGGTPTAAALAKVRQQLQALPQNGHSRSVLLVTDGGPNCNAGLNPMTCTCSWGAKCWDAEDCLDDAATEKELDALCAARIKTYVLGLGSAQSMTSVLGAMAQHGCTGTPHAATDPASIKQALQQITGGIASCSFEVDCTKIQDLYLVNFYLDGVLVPRNTARTSGWDWTAQCKPGAGKGTVELFGAECAAVKSAAGETIGAKYGCATAID